MTISKRIILIITILAIFSSGFINDIFKTHFFNKKTKSLTIPDTIFQNTDYTDDFSRLLNSSDNFLYCATSENSDNLYFQRKCSQLQTLKSAKKYKLITENISLLQKENDLNKKQSLSGFVRQNCTDTYAFCIISPKNKNILRFDLYEKDFIEMVLYDYERQFNKNRK